MERILVNLSSVKGFLSTHTIPLCSFMSFLDSVQLLMTAEGTSFSPSHASYFVRVEAGGHSSDYM